MRICWIDLLRVFSAFGVVLLHSTAYAVRNIEGVDFEGFVLLNTFTRFSVPVFFMCSGAVILMQNYKLCSLFYRVKRVLYPMLFWSLFYEAYLISCGVHKNISIILMDIVCDRVIYHFWFLYSLLGIILLLPVLSRMVSSMTLFEWSYLFRFVLGFSLIKTILIYLKVEFAPSYTTVPINIIYFCSGFFFCKFDIDRGIYIWLSIILFSILSISVLTIDASKTADLYSESFVAFDDFFVLLGSISIFLLFKTLGNLIERWKFNYILNIVQKATFTCYLLHVVVLDVLYSKIFQYNFYNSQHPVLASFFLAALTFIVCICVGIVLSKIKIIKDYV